MLKITAPGWHLCHPPREQEKLAALASTARCCFVRAPLVGEVVRNVTSFGAAIGPAPGGDCLASGRGFILAANAGCGLTWKDSVLQTSPRAIFDIDRGLAEAWEGDNKMKTRIHGAKLLLSTGIAVTLAIGMLAGGELANAAGPTSVGLGSAAPFAVLAGTPAVTNTGPTTVTGDLGISPAAAVTGFPPGTVSGTIHKADAVALQAKSDLVIAYNDAAGKGPVTQTIHILGGQTLVGGVYNAGDFTLGLTGTLTLDGQNDPNSVWIFQATSDLITAAGSSVAFINGAQPCNVFWQVTSSATLGAGSRFAGTILALASITMDSGVTVTGRALARNGDVTLINDTITRATCSTAASSASSTAASSASSASSSASSASSSASSASSSAGSSATPAVTSTASLPSRGGSTPLLAILTCVALGGLGFAAVEARRRRIRG